MVKRHVIKKKKKKKNTSFKDSLNNQRERVQILTASNKKHDLSLLTRADQKRKASDLLISQQQQHLPFKETHLYSASVLYAMHYAMHSNCKSSQSRTGWPSHPHQTSIYGCHRVTQYLQGYYNIWKLQVSILYALSLIWHKATIKE